MVYKLVEESNEDILKARLRHFRACKSMKWQISTYWLVAHNCFIFTSNKNIFIKNKAVKMSRCPFSFFQTLLFTLQNKWVEWSIKLLLNKGFSWHSLEKSNPRPVVKGDLLYPLHRLFLLIISMNVITYKHLRLLWSCPLEHFIFNDFPW